MAGFQVLGGGKVDVIFVGGGSDLVYCLLGGPGGCRNGSTNNIPDLPLLALTIPSYGESVTKA